MVSSQLVFCVNRGRRSSSFSQPLALLSSRIALIGVLVAGLLVIAPIVRYSLQPRDEPWVVVADTAIYLGR